MGSRRSDSDKRNLREQATILISGDKGVRLAPDETTGENDFKYERSPNVCGVIVDEGSGFGYVQISGGDKDTVIIYTGRGQTGFKRANISKDQTCMLYGYPTVLYIRPDGLGLS
ncbi:hypothetical protein BDV59DRAFT_182277 [Aspergillus ambiguus]|uniref:uncharacterized protein n=1 Tax=Aspergillus ambiguus TaxID=176160 RepID=UPI003CCD2184